MVENETGQLTVASFDRICRTCLSQEQAFRIIEVIYEDVSLHEILINCIGIQIEENLPQNICKICMTQLIQMHIFKQKCTYSDALLQATLNQHDQDLRIRQINAQLCKNEHCDSEDSIDLGQPEISRQIVLNRHYHEDGKNLNANLENSHILTQEKVQKEVEHYTINFDEACGNSNQKSDEEVSLRSVQKNHYLKNEKITNHPNNNRSTLKPIKKLQSNERPLSISCKLCNESFPSSMKLKEHQKLVTHILPRNYRCSQCPKAFCSNYHLQKHIKSHDKPLKKFKTNVSKLYLCGHCNKSFGSFKELTVHRQEIKHPREIRHKCSLCSKLFTNYRLKLHMRTHTKEKPYCCQICQATFSLRCNWSRHLKIHTGERPHVCEFCGKGFIQGSTYKEHRRIHTGETPFKCTICDRCFTARSSYKAHSKTHGFEDLSKYKKSQVTCDVKNYQCKICDKRYSTASLLKTHGLTHGEKKFLCNYCGKNFTTKGSLLLHMNVHSDVKRYVCLVCNKAFSTVVLLKTHWRIHTGEKPYICKICNKAFRQRNHLMYHMRTHSGEKPYSCKYCNKSFSLKTTLTVHTRIHTGETPYVCDICGKGFYHSNNMKKHRKIHGKVRNIATKVESNN